MNVYSIEKGIEDKKIRRWKEHIDGMEDNRLPKQMIYFSREVYVVNKNGHCHLKVTLQRLQTPFCMYILFPSLQSKMAPLHCEFPK